MFVGSCGEMAGLSNGSVLGERVSTADYTQPESNFIKSKMGDIDVGQQTITSWFIRPRDIR